MTKFMAFDRLFESIEDAKPIKTPETLDYCGNAMGKDVECVDCGEPYEDYYVLSDSDEFGVIYLSQMFDDPSGDDFIQIRGVGKCPCCRGDA